MSSRMAKTAGPALRPVPDICADVLSMSTERFEARLEEVLAHTGEMLAVARTADWARLAALQGAHGALLGALMSGADLRPDSHGAMLRLRQIEQANRELIDLVRARCDRLAQEIHGYGVGRRAVSAYCQHEPIP